MVRILWLSDFVAPTGFARVSHSIIKHLPKDEYKIIGLGVNYRGDPHGYDFDIFPAMLAYGDIYGLQRLPGLIRMVNPDIIFCINDAWIQTHYLQKIKEIYRDDKRPLPRIVTYTPVDSTFHDKEWYNNFDIVTAPVAYNEFGRKVLVEATDGKVLPSVIEHGVDASVFYKVQEGQRFCRLKVFGTDDNKDIFIVFNGNRNQPRKRLDISLKAFSIFAEGKEDVKYYSHCGVTDSHIDVVKVANRLGIGGKLILTSLSPGVQGVPTETLNDIYNCCDVGINTSLGEGFGLVNVEHAITGAPQIVGNYSAMSELYEDVGLLVEPTLEHVIDKINTVGQVLNPVDVAEKLELLYNDRDLLKSLSEKSIERFSSYKYSWKRAGKEWHELFQSII